VTRDTFLPNDFVNACLVSEAESLRCSEWYRVRGGEDWE